MVERLLGWVYQEELCSYCSNKLIFVSGPGIVGDDRFIFQDGKKWTEVDGEKGNIRL